MLKVSTSVFTLTDATASPTAAQFCNGRFISNGTESVGRDLNIPTAANIVAAITNAVPGTTFDVYIDNGPSPQTRTLVVAGGVTLTGSTAILTSTMARLTGIVRVTTPASEAVILLRT
jgi:hypothetical protein